MADKFDCVVIGSGPGGYAAAIRAAQRGASVALVEKDRLGGTCLNCGCIPSKALLASARTLLAANRAAEMGIDIESATADWQKIQSRKNTITTALAKGLAGLIAANGITVFEGLAAVTSPNKVTVSTDSGRIAVEADKIILATGSEPAQLPALPFDGQTVLSSKDALELQQMPESLLVVGGGVIGCELACAYAALGTKVTIVEALARLLPMQDEWVGRLLARQFSGLGITVLTNTTVASAEKNQTSATLTLQDGRRIEAEKVLVAVGRKPVCDPQTIQALGLKMTGSAIAVNRKMQTSCPDVYAVGDVVGTTYLAHGAFAEAEVAAANATGGDRQIADYSLIPRAVYTFPEVASVGMTEQDCRNRNIDVSVGRYAFRANGRSLAEAETLGEVRALRDTATDTIVGVTMVGSMVTELIAAAAALIGTKRDVATVNFPHPTASEALKEAIEDAFGLSLHNPPGRR